MPPVQAPGPFSFLENVTLSKADVAQLKTTVDTFAASYTSGADAAADKAALSALETGMQSLLANIWSETHVVSKDALNNLQQSVNSFVASYTGGTNVAQDTSAWAALQSGLNDFLTSVSASGSPTNPMPMALPLLPRMAMPMMLPNAIVIGSRPVMVAPASASGAVSGTSTTTSATATTTVSGAGTVTSGVATPDFMLALPTISKDDITKLQQAVDAFAAAYTSGTDPAADKTAVSNLESSLSSLAQNWQPPVPVQVTPLQSSVAPPSGVVASTQSGATPSATGVVTTQASATPPAGTVVTAPAATTPTANVVVNTQFGATPPVLPPGAFVSMPISSLAGWIPGIGRPLGAPIVPGP
jgi:hypothetical protein